MSDAFLMNALHGRRRGRSEHRDPDARATLKANKDAPIPSDIEAEFTNYVDTLEEEWGDSPTDLNTPPGCAEELNV